MNRTEKKCVIATVAVHLLLLTILVVGPAFYNPRPKADNAQVLDMIPANLVDAVLNSGVRNATPPAPAPAVSAPAPQPTPPPPVAHQAPPPPPPPVTQPTPSFEERVKKFFEPKPATPVPAPAPAETRHKILINTQLVVRASTQAYSPATARDDSQARLRASALNAARALEKNLAPGTVVDVPGNSSAAYANYASVVKSVYERTLVSFLPDSVAADKENTKVNVTIASDGTVISSTIVAPSGDPAWDAAVQHTLDRVTFIAPFPEGTTDKERHYTINFNPQVERTLE